MSKQYVQLLQDYIIQTRFNHFEIKTDKGSVIDWADDEKKKAKGKDMVDGVYVLLEKRDEYGNSTNFIEKAWLYKEDIKVLAKKIEEIESTEKIDYPSNDLPF